ncbi:MAG: hypothetical protein NTV23_04185 [Propionibacteriales bacterium]|nr:hypothetical protein [Propionibacteriales bacterium]
MARRFPPLTERQVEVLQWISDGCPDGVWADFTYKRTSYALAERGLAEVDRRRGSWSARTTSGGEHYLSHGAYRTDPIVAATRPSQAHATTSSKQGTTRNGRYEVDAVELIADLQRAEDGAITVTDPAASVRAGYRSALSQAVNTGLVPDGYKLTYTGRDRGDLVIRLLPHDNEPPAEALPPIRIPESLRGAADAVVHLKAAPELLAVSNDMRPRALRILAGIAGECTGRGWTFAQRPDGEPTFQITVTEVEFVFCLFEEIERRDVPIAEELDGAKYEWQRVRSSVQQVHSGRLALRLGERYSTITWADRKRWTLDDKLPQMFEHLRTTAVDVLAARERQARDLEERTRAWEKAVESARKAYVAQVNRDQLHEQLADRDSAVRMRAYAADLEASRGGEADRGVLVEWVEWIRAEADRVDPLLHPKRLGKRTPPEVRSTDLEPFMPRGMSPWRPPG